VPSRPLELLSLFGFGRNACVQRESAGLRHPLRAHRSRRRRHALQQERLAAALGSERNPVADRVPLQIGERALRFRAAVL
jgi:hypothetical protein